MKCSGTGLTLAPGQGGILVRSSFAEPRAQSLFLDAITPPFAVARTAFPFVRLTWGVGQGVHQAEIDLRVGCVASPLAQDLSCEIVYPAGTGPTIRVAASIAEGLAQHEPP